MLFTSPIFIFIFLPVFLLIYFVLPKKLRNIFLLIANLIFYSWGEGKIIAVMLTSVLIDYSAGLGLSGGWKGEPQQLIAGGERTKSQKLILILSLSGNLLLLAFFKYFNFGISNFNAVMGALGLNSAQLKNFAEIALPLGISFYTFQSMSYTIDIYRGHIKASKKLINFASYVTMFPQLIAGPIVRYAQVAQQLVHRVITREKFIYGIKRFIIGLSKKMLVANTLAVPADVIFSLPPSELNFFVSWLGVVCYALQIYFDFSGYSDMAIGLGHMLGFKFLENFNYPYIASSIREFWQRWHISMSSWFRDYVYIPLGGNRRSPLRVYLNLAVVFFLVGLWHGASWNFVIWGLFHGLFLILERFGWGKILKLIWPPLRHIYVLVVILVGWVFFRAEIGAVWPFLKTMFSFNLGPNPLGPVEQYLNPLLITVLFCGLLGSTNFLPWINKKISEFLATKKSLLVKASGFVYSGITFILWLAVFVASAAQLASDTYNPFIYFRF